jgi:hypothetical protein
MGELDHENVDENISNIFHFVAKLFNFARFSFLQHGILVIRNYKSIYVIPQKG